MDVFARVAVLEGVCRYLRDGAADGRWPDGKVPPVRTLAKTLDVSPTTVMKAVRQLEAEGFFIGEGRSRRISKRTKRSTPGRVLRLGILLAHPVRKLVPADSKYLQSMVALAEHSGLTVVYTAKSKEECDGNPELLRTVIEAARADAWLAVCSEQTMLEALAATGRPVFSYGGWDYGLPVSGVSVRMTSAVVEVTRRLIAYGHKRIVLFAPSHWVDPVPLSVATAFLDELAGAGLKPSRRPGSYNLPLWDRTSAGASRIFEELFRLTPPTAIIFIEAAPLLVLQGFLAARRRAIPQDVSVFVTDDDPILDWIRPQPAHATYDFDEIVRHAERWLTNILRGRSSPEWHYLDAVPVFQETLAQAARR